MDPTISNATNNGFKISSTGNPHIRLSFKKAFKMFTLISSFIYLFIFKRIEAFKEASPYTVPNYNTTPFDSCHIEAAFIFCIGSKHFDKAAFN